MDCLNLTSYPGLPRPDFIPQPLPKLVSVVVYRICTVLGGAIGEDLLVEGLHGNLSTDWWSIGEARGSGLARDGCSVFHQLTDVLNRIAVLGGHLSQDSRKTVNYRWPITGATVTLQYRVCIFIVADFVSAHSIANKRSQQLIYGSGLSSNDDANLGAVLNVSAGGVLEETHLLGQYVEKEPCPRLLPLPQLGQSVAKPS